MNTSAIFKFLGIALVSYSLLVIVSNTTAVYPIHGKCLEYVAQNFLPKAFPKAFLEVRYGKKGDNTEDLFVRFTSNDIVAQARKKAKQTGKKTFDFDIKKFTINVARFWIVPFAFLFALFVATPLSFKKRMLLFALMSFGFISFLCLKLYVYTYFRIGEKMLGIYEYDSTGVFHLERIKSHLGIGSTVIFLMVIWIISMYKLMPNLLSIQEEQKT